MARRKQSITGNTGFDAATGVESQVVFVSALLRADNARQIAERVLQQVHRFGGRGLRLVWTQAALPGQPSTRAAYPDTAPGSLESGLIERAFAIAAPAHATQGSAHLLASVLELAGGRAVLVTQWPDAVLPVAHDKSWREFLELVGARLDSTLHFMRQQHAMEGFEKAARLQRALYTIADVASSSELSMAEMLHHLHEVVGELMYAENFLIALYDSGRDSVRFIYFADTQDPRTVDPELEYPAESIGSSLTLAVIRHARPAMGPSEHLRTQFGLGSSNTDQYGPESADWLGVPMLADGEARGAVVVQSYDPATHYTDEDRALLAFVAQPTRNWSAASNSVRAN
jgi:hypothetical protein